MNKFGHTVAERMNYAFYAALHYYPLFTALLNQDIFSCMTILFQLEKTFKYRMNVDVKAFLTESLEIFFGVQLVSLHPRGADTLLENSLCPFPW